jgi:ketosteroid isomerase-like protein
MPEAERELILAAYRAMERQDWDDVFRHAHEKFEFKPPELGLASPAHGRARAREAIETFFSPYEEIEIEPREFRERGDRIAVTFVMRTRPRGSSAMLEIHVGHLWTIRDGKLAALEIYPRRENAMEVLESAPDRSAPEANGATRRPA